MQNKSNKTLQLNKEFGILIKKMREQKNQNKSRLYFCYEYELDAGNLSRIENGVIDTKLSTLWRISEALEIPLSELFKKLEQELGKDFTLMDK